MKCIRAKGEMCSECGDREEIEVHHIDSNRLNNELENLIPLCHSCHMCVHNGEDGYEHLTEKLSQEPPGGDVSEEKIGREMGSIHD